MAIVLKVTPEELQSKSGEISREVSDIKNQFEKIGQLVSASKGYWEGEASNAHQRFFDSYKDNIDEVVRRMQEHPRDLLTMAGIYSDSEAAAVDTASSLIQDVIV